MQACSVQSQLLQQLTSSLTLTAASRSSALDDNAAHAATGLGSSSGCVGGADSSENSECESSGADWWLDVEARGGATQEEWVNQQEEETPVGAAADGGGLEALEESEIRAEVLSLEWFIGTPSCCIHFGLDWIQQVVLLMNDLRDESCL